MKTNLERSITNKVHADEFITELFNNNELFHFDDDIEDDWFELTKEEKQKLESLVDKLFEIDNYDPFELPLELVTKKLE